MQGAKIGRYWLLAYGLVAACLIWAAITWRPNVSAYPVQGVDVSEADGEIAWPTVEAAGADFAYIKASEGADVTDPRFVQNWAGTAAAGRPSPAGDGTTVAGRLLPFAMAPSALAAPAASASGVPSGLAGQGVEAADVGDVVEGDAHGHSNFFLWQDYRKVCGWD